MDELEEALLIYPPDFIFCAPSLNVVSFSSSSLPSNHMVFFNSAGMLDAP